MIAEFEFKFDIEIEIWMCYEIDVRTLEGKGEICCVSHFDIVIILQINNNIQNIC